MKKLLKIAVSLFIVGGASLAGCYIDSPQQSRLTLHDVKTDSAWHSSVPEKWIGVPNIMYRVRDPWTVKVENIQGNVMEQIRIIIDNDGFQREHIG